MSAFDLSRTVAHCAVARGPVTPQKAGQNMLMQETLSVNLDPLLVSGDVATNKVSRKPAVFSRQKSSLELDSK